MGSVAEHTFELWVWRLISSCRILIKSLVVVCWFHGLPSATSLVKSIAVEERRKYETPPKRDKLGVGDGGRKPPSQPPPPPSSENTGSTPGGALLMKMDGPRPTMPQLGMDSQAEDEETS